MLAGSECRLSRSGHVIAPFRLEVLTPVHIGSGVDFSPLEYVVHGEQDGSYQIWLVDTQAWLAGACKDQKVAKALDDGDMAALRALMNGSSSIEGCVLARIRIAANELGKKLFDNRTRIEKKAEIMAFSRNPFTHLPYLPASSIKGALSTPLIDYLNAQGVGRPLRKSPAKDYPKILEEMFGEISSHAMRDLKMADIALPPNVTSIRRATGIDISPPATMVKTPCEALDPAGVNASPVYGRMSFASVNGKGGISFSNGSLITEQKLREICNRFYLERFEQEYAKFYTRDNFKGVPEALAKVRERVARLDKSKEMLLRLGRYSHIECMTVAGTPPPGSKGGPGTSRTLADGKIPFGWVIFKACSLEEYEQGAALLDKAWQDEVERITKIASETARRKQAAEEAARLREEEEKRKAEELAALTPEQRAIRALREPDAVENKASEIYSKLDEYGEYKLEAATALMEFWQRINKWQGKGLTKRQQEKVRKVKEILGL